MENSFNHDLPINRYISNECQLCGAYDQDAMVCCSRCFTWFHYTCCDYNPQMEDWFCYACRAKRARMQAPPSTEAAPRNIVLPVIRFVRDVGLGFIDEGQELAEVVTTTVSRLDQRRSITQLLKRIWVMGGRQSNCIDMLLTLDKSGGLSKRNQYVYLFEYSSFASIGAESVAEEMRKAFALYTRSTIGRLLKRGLQINMLLSIIMKDGNKLPVTAVEVRATQNARLRIDAFLYEQASRLVGRTWDSHLLWEALKEPLKALIKTGERQDLLALVEAGLPGAHAIVDLTQREDAIYPPCILGIAGSADACAEKTIHLNSVEYSAERGLKTVSTLVSKVESIPYPDDDVWKGAFVVAYTITGTDRLTCAVCGKDCSAADFELNVCSTCIVSSVCRCCVFTASCIRIAQKSSIRCCICNIDANLSKPGVNNLLKEGEAFVQLLIHLNPKDGAVIRGLNAADVILPPGSHEVSREHALTMLLDTYREREDHMSIRTQVQMIRQDLRLPLDMDDAEVLRLGQQQMNLILNVAVQNPPAGNAVPPPPVNAAPPVAGNAAPPVVGNAVPPVAGNAVPPVAGNAAPPVVGNAVPPVAVNAVPPVVGNAVPPVAVNAVPPVVGNAVPPVVGNAVPPVAGNAAPPVVGNAVPPVAVNAVPPVVGNAVPPVVGNAVPPPPVNAVPPPPVNAAPPVAGNAVPPVVGNAVPPVAGNAVPPVVGNAVPPVVGNAVPPVAGNAVPPPPVNAVPPVVGNAVPPVVGNAVPPVAGNAVPPPPVNAVPPVAGNAVPPVVGNAVPPVVGNAVPPPPVNAVPPVAGNAVPPVVGNAVPPVVGNAVPPVAGNAVPPPPVNAVPPVAGNAVPPVVGNAVPPVAGNAVPPVVGNAVPPVVGTAVPPPPVNAVPPVAGRRAQPHDIDPHIERLQLVLSTTTRANASFWYQGRQYSFVRAGATSDRYRCLNGPRGSRCSASMTLYHDGLNSRISREEEHVPGCVPTPQQQELELAARRVREQFEAGQNPNVRTILNEGENTYTTVRDEDRLRNRLYHWRQNSNQAIPSGPTDSAEFRQRTHENIENLSQTTRANGGGEAFLRFNDVDDHIAVWAATECLTRLESADMLFIDGTFRITPPGFYQTLTVTASLGTQFVPVAWALLPNATEGTYRMALRELRRAVTLQTGHCNAVMADFEMALRRGITSVFGLNASSLRGCIFHAHRAWYRRLIELGLGPAYREVVPRGQPHSPLNNWLHCIFGLCCLPPNEVSAAWDALVAHSPNDQRVADFRVYMERNWVRNDSVWPPVHWAAVAGERHRTNNAAEALHSSLKDHFIRGRSERPGNINLFIERLQSFHQSVRRKLRSTEEAVSRRAVDKERARVEITDQYRRGAINLIEFLQQNGRMNTFPRNIID